MCRLPDLEIDERRGLLDGLSTDLDQRRARLDA
jgi:hypothetical protein